VSDVPVSDGDTEVGSMSGRLATGTGGTTPHERSTVTPHQRSCRT